MATETDGLREVGVLIEDCWQGRRLGTRLVGLVLVHARARGCRTVRADVLASNLPMQRIALGYGAAPPGAESVLRFAIPVTAPVRQCREPAARTAEDPPRRDF
jgi:GNAT superfamily N-acetyltransferase